jgi:hypothetical protein
MLKSFWISLFPVEEKSQELLESVLSHKSVMALYDKETGQKTEFYTTSEVRSEEEKLIRFADHIAGRSRESLNCKIGFRERVF